MSNIILEAEDLELSVMHGKEVRLKITYDFKIEEGDFVIVKGRNGSGKSTLFKAICKTGTGYFKKSGKLTYNDPDHGFNNVNILDIADSGEEKKRRSLFGLFNKGKEYDEAARLRRTLVYIGQEDTFVSWATARNAVFDSCWHAVSYGNTYTKEEAKEKKRELNELIDSYFEAFLKDMFSDKYSKKNNDPYKEFCRRKVTDLSGGQQKLLHVLSGVIKAQICGCKLVILDEPLNNLDGENKARINEMFKTIMKNNKSMAVLVITHCQIFESINKVLVISPEAEGVNVCEEKALEENYICHEDCLKEYKNEECCIEHQI